MRWVVMASLAFTLLGGCLERAGPDVDSGTGARHSRNSDDDGEPKKVCEHTMEGNEAKTFCY